MPAHFLRLWVEIADPFTVRISHKNIVGCTWNTQEAIEWKSYLTEEQIKGQKYFKSDFIPTK